MAERDLTNTKVTDMSNAVTDYSVDPVNTDGSMDQKETEWVNTDWAEQLGYYKKIPEIKTSIDALARWTIGKGFVTNEITEMLLMNFRGIGVDSFNSILKNQIRVKKIGGDSYAEIVRFGGLLNKIKSLFRKDNRLLNLKPLNPGVMKTVTNRKGIIIRYEQIDRDTKKTVQKFKPQEIFHLSNNRIADEIHGTSMIDAVKEIILMRNEAMTDMKQLMHRFVKPRFFFHVDTDNKAEIAALQVKFDEATDKGENILIPKGAVVPELLSVASNATLNPLPWINNLNQYFFQASGVPQIVVGGSQEITEASAKITYLSWEQTVEEEQLDVEEQVLAQLNLEIELEFPASLKNEMLSSESKSETMQASTPEDTNVQGVPLGGT